MVGSPTDQQVTGAANRGATPHGGYTDWEMAHVYDERQLRDTNFVRGGTIIENPWAE